MLIRLDENSYQVCDKACAGNTSNYMCYYDLPITYILRNGYTRDVFATKVLFKNFGAKQDLNLRPLDYKSSALPTELSAP